MRIKGVPPKMPEFVAPTKPDCLTVLARTEAIYDTDMGEQGNWTPAAYLAMDKAFRSAVIKSQGRIP